MPVPTVCCVRPVAHHLLRAQGTLYARRALTCCHIRAHQAAELELPEESLSLPVRGLLRGLLTLDVPSRLGCGVGGTGALKAHPFYSSVAFDWEACLRKELKPPGPASGSAECSPLMARGGAEASAGLEGLEAALVQGFTPFVAVEELAKSVEYKRLRGRCSPFDGAPAILTAVPAAAAHPTAAISPTPLPLRVEAYPVGAVTSASRPPSPPSAPPVPIPRGDNPQVLALRFEFNTCAPPRMPTNRVAAKRRSHLSPRQSRLTAPSPCPRHVLATSRRRDLATPEAHVAAPRPRRSTPATAAKSSPASRRRPAQLEAVEWTAVDSLDQFMVHAPHHPPSNAPTAWSP